MSASEAEQDADDLLDVLAGSLPLWCEWLEHTDVLNVQSVCSTWSETARLALADEDADNSDASDRPQRSAHTA